MRNHSNVEYVWVIDEEVVAEVVTLNTHFAVVKFVKNGIDYEVMLETEEFMSMDNSTERGLGCGLGDYLDE